MPNSEIDEITDYYPLFSTWLSGKSNPGGSGDKAEQPSSSKASEGEY